MAYPMAFLISPQEAKKNTLEDPAFDTSAKTKKNAFLFGYVLAYSYLCQRIR